MRSADARTKRIARALASDSSFSGGFGAAFHVSDRNLNRQMPAPNVLLTPGHDYPIVVGVAVPVSLIKRYCWWQRGAARWRPTR